MRDGAHRHPRRSRLGLTALAAASLLLTAVPALASTPGADVRLSNDAPGTSGYVSNYTAVTGQPYTDATLTECSRARGRQNEPAVAVNPRNPQVIVGSSNDYCGTYNDGSDADGAPLPVGPIWLGYYRSQNGGASFQSSLVPGYPGDTSPYAARAQVRTASSGDPVLAWDGDGRLFAGSESSEDPAGSKKTFGDVWVATYENPAGVGGATVDDGKEFRRAVIINRGSSAPNLLGVFNDKTSIAADRTDNAATRGNVYFAWSRFTGNGGSNIYVVRSTDHGATFSNPKLLTTSENDIQDPDIAIRGDGTVTVTWSSSSKQSGLDSVGYAVSTNGGATWSPARTLTTYTSYDAQDVSAPTATAPISGPDFEGGAEERDATGDARDCGVLASACRSGYIFFRRTTSPRSSADQTAPGNPLVYVVLEPVVPGSEVPTGTTYGAVEVGVGGQSAVYALAFNPLTGARTGPVRVEPEAAGHQLFADVVADSGVVHVLWWDSRNDRCYSPARPVGNCADGTLTPSLDAYGATLSPALTAVGSTRLSDLTSNPNWDQYAGRTVPFAGDYLWIDSAAGRTYSVWTDYRNTVPGNDPRTASTRGDVLQCRTQRADGTYTGDTCPRAGGLDQDIYGDLSP
ncbi:MAG: sialidase family protein [Mycobacteriales bacterium]